MTRQCKVADLLRRVSDTNNLRPMSPPHTLVETSGVAFALAYLLSVGARAERIDEPAGNHGGASFTSAFNPVLGLSLSLRRFGSPVVGRSPRVRRCERVRHSVPVFPPLAPRDLW